MPVAAVQTLLDQYWNNVLPVDLSLFTDPLGLTVHVTGDLGMPAGTLSGDVILVNGDDPEYRQRFTIAHEIGHAYLGHGDAYRNTTTRTYSGPEIEANCFAAELLMPTIAMRVLIEVEKITDPTELRGIFNVSAEAMRYRLQNLGYIKE